MPLRDALEAADPATPLPVPLVELLAKPGAVPAVTALTVADPPLTGRAWQNLVRVWARVDPGADRAEARAVSLWASADTTIAGSTGASAVTL